MVIEKTWAMPNAYTFDIKPINEWLLQRIPNGAKCIVDPFAGNSVFGTITNDLNPDADTDYHMDALDFLKMLPDKSADVVLYDPPYSLRQVSECYKRYGREVTMQTTQASYRARHLDEIARILKNGGCVFCFGWNSNGVGKCRGFEMTDILMVAHGGSHNDTICTKEVKREQVV